MPFTVRDFSYLAGLPHPAVQGMEEGQNLLQTLLGLRKMQGEMALQPLQQQLVQAQIAQALQETKFSGELQPLQLKKAIAELQQLTSPDAQKFAALKRQLELEKILTEIGAKKAEITEKGTDEERKQREELTNLFKIYSDLKAKGKESVGTQILQKFGISEKEPDVAEAFRKKYLSDYLPSPSETPSKAKGSTSNKTGTEQGKRGVSEKGEEYYQYKDPKTGRMARYYYTSEEDLAEHLKEVGLTEQTSQPKNLAERVVNLLQRGFYG